MDMAVLFQLACASFMMAVVAALSSSADCQWPPRYIHKRRSLNREILSYSELTTLHYYMEDGFYKPENCTAKQKVAIIVPYRDREPQLKIFLLNVLSRLYRQQLAFGIYVIEQPPGKPFNKGALINVGYLQASMDQNYDCYIIHDVDIIPEDDRNYYVCGDNPRHLAYLVEQFGYRPHTWEDYFGGVLALSSEQFYKINGFSNLYSGWGFEDDDCNRRILSAGYSVDRPPAEVSYCGSVNHTQASKQNDRCETYLRYARMFRYDGLNSIQYSVLRKESKQLFRRILVNFDTEMFRKNDIKYRVVPASCTGELQPLDLSGNDEFKTKVRESFVNWYSEEISKQLDLGKNVKDIKIYLKISYLKPKNAS